jgi:hypothetical protein
LKALGFKTEKHIQDIAASCVGCIHSTTICVLTYDELAVRGWSPFSYSIDFDLASANTRTGIAAMAFTNSYMVRFMHATRPSLIFMPIEFCRSLWEKFARAATFLTASFACSCKIFF